MAKAKENKPLETVLAPVVEFNKLVMKNAEAAFNLQMEAIQAYAEMGLKSINAGFEVKDQDDLKGYAESQKEVAEEMTARVTADIKAFGELNTQFIDEARNLASANVKEATAKVVKEVTAKAA